LHTVSFISCSRCSSIELRSMKLILELVMGSHHGLVVRQADIAALGISEPTP